MNKNTRPTVAERYGEGWGRNDVVRRMKNPEVVILANLEIFLASSFMFSEGNNTRLAMYWIYLLENGYLSDPVLKILNQRVVLSEVLPELDLSLLQDRDSHYKHKSAFRVEAVSKAIYHANSTFLQLKEELNTTSNRYQRVVLKKGYQAFKDSVDTYDDLAPIPRTST